MTIVLVVLNVFLLILLTGTAWVLFRLYRPRLSSIEEELRAITTQLGRLPDESSLKEHLSAHEQQLRSIGERLHAHPDAELLHRYLQDQTDQLLAIISTHESGARSELTRADLEQSLRQTNANVERVLWSLRFDEEKYQENPDAGKNAKAIVGKRHGTEQVNADGAGRDDREDTMLSRSLKAGADGYQAMLDYMRTTGSSGTDALHALEMAKVIHGR